MPDKIVWGEDSFGTRAQAEKGIATYLVGELDNNDCGSVEIDGKPHLLRVTVEILD